MLQCRDVRYDILIQEEKKQKWHINKFLQKPLKPSVWIQNAHMVIQQKWFDNGYE